MTPDRTAYDSHPTLLHIIRPACPKCGSLALDNGGTHGGIGYFVCDSCRLRIKARVEYVPRDERYFRPAETPMHLPPS